MADQERPPSERDMIVLYALWRYVNQIPKEIKKLASSEARDRLQRQHISADAKTMIENFKDAIKQMNEDDVYDFASRSDWPWFDLDEDV